MKSTIVCIFGSHMVTEKKLSEADCRNSDLREQKRCNSEERNTRIFIRSSLADSTSRIERIFDNDDGGSVVLQQQHCGWGGSRSCYRPRWKALRLIEMSNLAEAGRKDLDDDLTILLY